MISVITILWASHPAAIANAQSYSATDFSSRTKVGSIEFAFDSSLIENSQLDQIKRLAAEYQRLSSQNISVVVVGHADGVGSTSYNLRLSAARARGVAEKLGELLTTAVTTEWEGKTRLADPEQPDAAVNRRVDVFVECNLKSGNGFCSCLPKREVDSIVVAPEPEIATEEWIITTRIAGDTVLNCRGGLAVETRFIDVQTSSSETFVDLINSLVDPGGPITIWRGFISNGDELIISLVNSGRQCGIGLDFDEYSTIELEAVLVGSELIPLVTAGAAMADISSNDEYLFRSSAGGCEFDLDLNIGKITSVDKPF